MSIKEKYKIARKEGMRPDYTIDQIMANYTPDDHAVWRDLFERQVGILPGRVCDEYWEGIKTLDMAAGGGVPDFERLSDVIEKKTRWRIVAVAGAIPVGVFFEHLANRRFPVTEWIRAREEMDYLEEPDAFHDIFGHVPLLVNPVFADYMEAYGKGGLKAMEQGAVKYLGRLYWYTVEFGLMRGKDGGFRIYGAGITSSKTESIYSVESPIPHRIAFDIQRIMRTDFDITHLQQTYFVINSFEQLFEATLPDFTPYYEVIKAEVAAGMKPHSFQTTVPTDKILRLS
jgi:phenylalanine-4-hydroxylase